VGFDPEKAFLEIKALLADTKKNISDNNGWDLGDFKDVFRAVTLVVQLVEKYGKEVGATSKEKKQTAVKTLNWLIDIPVVPEWLEGKVIGVAIDAAVAALNKFKHDWTEKVLASAAGDILKDHS